MANLPEKIAWDACIIIDCLEKNRAGPYQFIGPLVKDAEDGKLVVVVSTLSIAESIYVRGHAPDEQLKIIDEFYDFPWVRTEASGLAIGKIARDLRRNHGIDGIDSIHVATAISTSCPIFLTMDGAGRRKKKTMLLPLDNLLSLSGKPPFLRIRTPEEHQKILFAVAAPLLSLAPAPAPAPAVPVITAPAAPIVPPLPKP